MTYSIKIEVKIVSIFIVLVACLCVSGCQRFVEGYKIEHGEVYYTQLSAILGRTKKMVDSADYKSFETLWDSRYGLDKDNVYVFGKVLYGADPKSFERVKGTGFLKMYTKDKSSVFMENLRIPDADPDSFRLISGDYAMDKNHVFYFGEKFTSSSENFKIIDKYYSMDDADIYLLGSPLKVCSVKDFKFVFGKDENNIDWSSESASERWAKDGCHYYFGGIRIPSNDYENIIVFKESPGIVKDSRFVYHKDRNIMFNIDGEKILDTIDIETFICERLLKCKDKFGPINIFCGITECDGTIINE